MVKDTKRIDPETKTPQSIEKNRLAYDFLFSTVETIGRLFFSTRYDPEITRPYLTAMQHGEPIDPKTAIIVTTLGLPDQLPHLEAFGRIGKLAAVIPDTIIRLHPKVIEQWRAAGIPVIPPTEVPLNDWQDPAKAIPRLRKLTEGFERIYISDHGQILARIMPHICRDKILGSKLIAVTENRAGPQEEYKAILDKVTVPITFNSEAAVNDFENNRGAAENLIGLKVALKHKGFDKGLRSTDSQGQPSFPTIGVLGTGGVGRQLVKHLAKSGNLLPGQQIIFAETDKKQAKKVLTDNRHLSQKQLRYVSHNTFFKNADIIIASTGNKAIDAAACAKMKDNVIIATTSTFSEEFKVSGYDAVAPWMTEMPVLRSEMVAGTDVPYFRTHRNHKTGKKLSVALDGMGVNYLLDQFANADVKVSHASRLACAIVALYSHFQKDDNIQGWQPNPDLWPENFTYNMTDLTAGKINKLPPEVAEILFNVYHDVYQGRNKAYPAAHRPVLGIKPSRNKIRPSRFHQNSPEFQAKVESTDNLAEILYQRVIDFFRPQRDIGEKEDIKGNKVGIVAVAQTLPDTLAYLKKLATIRDIAAVIPKGNKRLYADVIQEWRDAGFTVLDDVDKKKLTDPDYANSILKSLLRNRKTGKTYDKLYLADHGGYFAPFAATLEHSGHHIFSGISDVSVTGENRYEPLRFHQGITSYGRTGLKDTENYSIARDCVLGAEGILNEVQSSPSRRDRSIKKVNEIKTIGIVGAGGVGENIARYLRGQEKYRNVQILVNDIDKVKNIALWDQGYTIANKEYLFKQSDWVILASSFNATDKQHLGALKSGAIVSTVTSVDDEIPMRVIDRLPNRPSEKRFGKSDVPLYRTYQNPLYPNRHFHLLLDGIATNYVLSQRNTHTVKLTHAAKLAHAITALADYDCSELVGRYVVRLNQQAQDDIARIWLETYPEQKMPLSEDIKWSTSVKQQVRPDGLRAQ